MLTRPLDVVINAIANSEQVYVWVYCDPTYSRSIKISISEAIRWCKDVSKDRKNEGGDVPCFIANGEVFLGSMVV